MSHLSVRGKKYQQVADDIVGLRDQLASQCGVPKE